MADHGFEDFLRASLFGAVAGAGSPPPLPKRRVRMRQAALMGAAGAVVVLGALGVVSVSGGMVANDGSAPAGPSGGVFDERGSGGTYPCPQDGDHGRRDWCIATGERHEVSWTLGVSIEHDSELCMTFEAAGGPGGGIASGGGSSCNEYEPDGIGLEQTGIGDLPRLAYGPVPAAADSLVLEHGADESFALEIYPAPAGFPLDAAFYLVWLPDDAVRLVAYDEGGSVVATRELDGSPEGQGPPQYVDIDEGTFRGVPWAFSAYGDLKDGREIACTRVLLGRFLSGSLAPCDASFGRESAAGITPYFSLSELPGFTAMSGVTSSQTGSVTFVAGGREIEATMIEPPPAIEQSLRFFVAFVPSGRQGQLTATVIVRDRSGEVIEERDVCVPGGEGLSC